MAGNAAPERLAVFAPGWLGDAVMAIPAIADLRRALPEASIQVIARPAVAALFPLVSGVDDTIALPARGAGRRDGLAAIRGRRFDAALLLPNSFNVALTAWRAGIPERWGYRSDWRSPLLTRPIASPTSRHQGALYQHLVAELGFPNGPLTPELSASPDAVASARRLLAGAGWDEHAPLVALAPGAAYGGAKRWPPESFAALATVLAGEGARPVVVGSDADREAAADVQNRAGGVAIDLTGQTDVPGLAGVLTLCRTLVTNDSGAMHVAAALDVPVVALFGPTRERETHPLGRVPPVVLVHDVWCRPCMLRECPLTSRCMRGISVADVAAAVRSRL